MKLLYRLRVATVRTGHRPDPAGLEPGEQGAVGHQEEVGGAPVPSAACSRNSGPSGRPRTGRPAKFGRRRPDRGDLDAHPFRGVGAKSPRPQAALIASTRTSAIKGRGIDRAKFPGRRGSPPRVARRAGRPGSSGSAARAGGCRSRGRRSRPRGHPAAAGSRAGW